MEDTLGMPADFSIFKYNINPLRLGLLLYKTIDDIQKTFNYSKYVTKQLLSKIDEQLVKVLDIYHSPEEMVPIMEEPDFEGRNCYWYF